MRVCDRHNRKPATETIHIKSSDSTYDLCADCAKQIEKFISKSKKEAVESNRSFLGLKKRVV